MTKVIVEISVGKNPTLPGSFPQRSQVSFEDFLHDKKKGWQYLLNVKKLALVVILAKFGKFVCTE